VCACVCCSNEVEDIKVLITAVDKNTLVDRSISRFFISLRFHMLPSSTFIAVVIIIIIIFLAKFINSLG